MMTGTKWNIGTVTQTVRIGSDPEMADYDNPRGHIYGEMTFVMAEARDGRRRLLLDIEFADPEEAARFAATYDADAPNSEAWNEVQPAYGSDAYVNQHCEEHYWFEEQQAVGF